MFNSGSPSAIAENLPSQAMMFMQTSPIFGNNNFMITPATPGEVQGGFPSLPYMSLESQLYNQQMSNPIVAPVNIQTGSTGGTQNVSGNITTTDQTGNIRVAIGTGSF